MTSQKERERKRAYNHTPKGKAALQFRSIRARVANNDGKNPSYSKTKLKITREEFLTWAIPELERWMKDHPNGHPAGTLRHAVERGTNYEH